MGIEYSAAVVVGLRQSDFDHNVAYEDLADNGNLERFAPYYDAPSEECIYGLPVEISGDYSYTTLDLSQSVLDDLTQEFIKLTGHTPKLWLTVAAW